MLIYVHAEDIADAGRTYPRHTGLDVRHTMIARGLNARHMAAQILELLTDDELQGGPCIEMLVFNAHGAPGTLYIGEGIDEHNLTAIASPLRDLLVPFSDGGQGIEVYCDHVAPELRFEQDVPDTEGMIETGVRFIYTMAHDFGTRVRATLDLRMPDRFGFLEGTFVEALPDECADWHGNVRHLTSGEMITDDDVDNSRWQAAFSL
jgi:hypothetical protein